ncbi:hypothetical protein HZC30_07445 [Candidatus Woesearchaeota archaeon]|nr:hypothetical protein [Candidatus Woesearchaeota archaeon]
MSMTLGCSLKLEQKLEQRQSIELSQKLLLKLPSEFTGFLNLGKDEDTPLLRACLPFLTLHEYSHPLQAKGLVYVPKAEELTLNTADISQRSYHHNANEVGIDKSAMLLGPRIGYYSPMEMVCSHTAMMERVFRDYFTLEKFPPEITFVARLYAEMKEHATANYVPPEHRAKIDQLMSLAEGRFPAKEFNAVVEQYGKVYVITSLVSADTDNSIIETSHTFH